MDWHHSHASQPASDESEKQPLTYLILIADAVHNFVGGMFVAASFLVNVPLGLTAWLVAAAHEVPQELGDFGVLVHGGWGRARALLFNFLSGLTFLAGGVVAYFASAQFDVVFLVPFAAGNFLYIGATDLIPEIKKSRSMKTNLIHFVTFCVGLGLLVLVRFLSL